MTASQEEYLKAIYILENQNEDGVRITDIAKFLDVKKSSTNRALNNLKNEELINYEKYKNVTLTKNGEAIAKHIFKINELLEKFLVEILETDKTLAKTEAEQLCHCVSCHTTAKLEMFLKKHLKK